MGIVSKIENDLFGNLGISGGLEHKIMPVTGGVDMKPAKLEQSLDKAGCLDRNVLDMVEAERRNLAVEKTFLVDVDNFPIRNNPNVQVVIGPGEEKIKPDE